MEIIRKYADSGDREHLRYVFSGAFDADPTFAQYEEDYQYCKRKGVLDPHRELTPMTEDRSRWTEDYWYRIQRDLQENLSDRRLTHMKEVAKVVFADKVARLHKERAEEEKRRRAKREREESQRQQMERQSVHAQDQLQRQTAEEPVSDLERRIAEENRRKEEEMERAYREYEENQRRQQAERQQAFEEDRRRQQTYAHEDRQRSAAANNGGNRPKKAPGIAAAVILAAAVLLVLILLHRRGIL